MFGVQNWDPGGKAVEGPRAGGPSVKPRPRPQVRPAGGGGNFRSALGKRGAGAQRRGRRPVPRPFLGRGERIRPGPFPSLRPTHSGSSGPKSQRDGPDWARGDTWAVAPRLGDGGGGSSPSVSESRIRGGERDARITRHRNPGPGGQPGRRVSSSGDWDSARGWRRAQPRDPGALLPGNRGKGVVPQSCPRLPKLGGSSGFAPAFAGGRNAVGGTRAERAGEEGGHSPFPGPRPHCLSRLRPGPTPQHVLAALI